jgi:hypothetical protein
MQFLQEGTTLLGDFTARLEAFSLVAKDGGVCAGVGNNSTSTSTANAAITLAITVSDKTDKYLCTITKILRDIRGFFQCRTWYPLYQNTVHDTLCYSATDGFSWIASTQFVVVFMAIIVLTFRSSLFDLEIMDDDDDDDEDGETTTNDNATTTEQEMATTTADVTKNEETGKLVPDDDLREEADSDNNNKETSEGMENMQNRENEKDESENTNKEGDAPNNNMESEESIIDVLEK